MKEGCRRHPSEPSFFLPTNKRKKLKRLTYILTLALGILSAGCADSHEDLEVKKLVASQPVPVAFDTYVLQNADTRLLSVAPLPAMGATGSIESVERLRQVGFGVFATYTNGSHWSTASHEPNYMYDQKVEYVAGKWTYAPVKYWPNETTSDIHGATSDHTDYVSFFAYAPYVDYSAGATFGADNQITPMDRSQTHWGVVKMSDNYSNLADGPYIYYAPASVSTNSVDLLWAVAEDGGYKYQPVNHTSDLEVQEGMPFLNMIKPAVNRPIKFLFKHATARLGVNVKADVDLWDDAKVYTDALKDAAKNNTAITVDELRITGNFPSSAQLQLNNTTPGVPLWVNPTYDVLSSVDPNTGNVTTTQLNTHTYVLDEQSIAKSMRTPDYVYINNNVSNELSDDFKAQIGANSLLNATTPKPLLVQTKPVTSTEVRDDANSTSAQLSANELSANEEPTYLMVIPNPNDPNVTNLHVSITYSITSLDDHLMPTKNGYFRLTQTVEGDVSIPKIEAGKAYTLQCSIGLNTVLLEVNTYEWSEPITFGAPNVQPWTVVPDEKKEFDND